jgi:hypothetical protein
MDYITEVGGRVGGKNRDQKMVMVKLIVQKETKKIGIKNKN